MNESGSPDGGVSPDRPSSSVRREAAWRTYIRQISIGDEDAMEALYEESSRLVYGLTLRILGNPADAEEAAADVYSQVWRSAKTYSSERGSVTSWLVLLARSRAIDRLRARSGMTDEHGEDRQRAAEPAANPEQAASAAQTSGRVRAALNLLPENQRIAIELAFYGGYSQSELAQKLGLPLGTVKTSLRLGMMKLKEVLAAVYAEAGSIR